jgi:hypothetical protein
VTHSENKTPSQLYADYMVESYSGLVEISGYPGITQLDASALKSGTENSDTKAQRFELIQAVRGGKHIELAVTAQTFEQTSKPNRRFLRLAADKIASRAGTWKNQPYLMDHNTWTMKSPLGTILSSTAVETAGSTALHQRLNAVKPDAVIGILDGTFNKFSIGWWPNGPILCSLHGGDVMKNECDCWPGETFTIDGKEKRAEWVFSDFLGKEVSSVVIPAVQNTSIIDVRAALSAELGITTRRPTRNKESNMGFFRLAAALGLSAFGEADEERALAHLAALNSRAVTAETSLAAATTRLTQAEGAIKTLTAAALGQQIDAIIETGFSAGKIRRTRDASGQLVAGPVETWLRGVGQTPGGIEAMKALMTPMPVVVPLNERQALAAVEPALPIQPLSGNGQPALVGEDNPYLRNAAELTGQKVGDLVAFANGHIAGGV